MPIYEYKCQKCNTKVEKLQKMSDKPLTRCAACGGKLEKQWSNTSFQLKGSGWYVTDYAGKKGEAKDDGKTGGQAEAKKEGSAEKAAPVSESSTSNESAKPAADSKKESQKKSSKKAPATSTSRD